MTTNNQALIYLYQLQRAKLANPAAYWSVDVPSLADAEAGLIISNGEGYCLVNPDGDIKGLFKLPESTVKGVADDLLSTAVKVGGVKLDNYDTYLTKVYVRCGFRICARTAFNPDYAPKGWDKDQHGCPDVVALVYDPFYRLDIRKAELDTYEEVISKRDSCLA